MRSSAAIAVLLFYFPLSANASVLKGVVKENELGGSPMANVEISAPGANATKTGPDGQFILSFPEMKPGETVLVSVNKAGYVVVNDIQLEQSLPADPKAKLLVIFICRPSRREEMARRFNHLASWEAIEASYRMANRSAGSQCRADCSAAKGERPGQGQCRQDGPNS